MRRTVWLLVAPVLFAVAWIGLPRAGDVHELTGEYKWNNGAHGKLTAKFTGTGENTWDVDFNFKFDGTPHVYSGTAEGNLKDGELTGTVSNEAKKRTFTFAGTFEEDGEFRGTHAETTPGRSGETGTLTLTR